MAKKRGVPGWHSMRKDQLVRALLKTAQSKTKSNGKRSHNGNGNGKDSKSKTVAKTPAQKAATTRVRKKISKLQAKLQDAKNLTTAAGDKNGSGVTKDRLVVMVRDPFWLHVYWELSRQSVSRVQAAMGQRWHLAKPMLRLFEVTHNGGTMASDTLLRTIEIHGGVNNWYVDLKDPAKSYRLDIGYMAADDTFHTITRSNKVTTPPAAARDDLDENWSDVAENLDKIYAMSGGYSPEGDNQELRELLEERLRRPMGNSMVGRFGSANGKGKRKRGFHFDADAEMIIYGTTDPNARVMLLGEPVQVRADGTFTVRMNMPERRQVIPLVANSADGVEQRTIVLAVERNTKRMETLIRDGGGSQ